MGGIGRLKWIFGEYRGDVRTQKKISSNLQGMVTKQWRCVAGKTKGEDLWRYWSTIVDREEAPLGYQKGRWVVGPYSNNNCGNVLWGGMLRKRGSQVGNPQL